MAIKDVWHLARILERKAMFSFLVWKLGGMRTLGEPGVNVRIILRRIFRNLNVGIWTGLS